MNNWFFNKKILFIATFIAILAFGLTLSQTKAIKNYSFIVSKKDVIKDTFLVNFKKPVYLGTLPKTGQPDFYVDSFYSNSPAFLAQDINLNSKFSVFMNEPNSNTLSLDFLTDGKCGDTDIVSTPCDLQIGSSTNPFFVFNKDLYLDAGYRGRVGYTSSDVRLKENVKPLIGEEILDKVLKLNGYSFVFKDNDEKSFGVLAQEIKEIFPELIETKDGIHYVNYQLLIPLLLAAQKEQTKIINQQSQDFKRLEKLLSD